MDKNLGSPRPAAHGAPGQNAVRPNHRRLPRRIQPAGREARKAATRRFVCSFCGKSRPECDLMGRDGSLLFCGRCVTALDALRDGADDALAIWAEPS